MTKARKSSKSEKATCGDGFYPEAVKARDRVGPKLLRKIYNRWVESEGKTNDFKQGKNYKWGGDWL